MLTRCSPSSLVLCASNAQRDADTRRWSGEMRGSLTPLTTLTRLVWRFVEPSFPGDALRWKPVVPQPTMWEVRWKGVMLSFRRVAFGECDAIENAMFEALDALSTTNPTVTVSATPAGGLQITPCDSAPPDATVRYESSLYRQKKADSANRDKDLVFLVVPLASASCDSPALSRVKTALVKFHFAGQSLVVSPYDKRTDSIRFDADSIHAVPETIKPGGGRAAPHNPPAVPPNLNTYQLSVSYVLRSGGLGCFVEEHLHTAHEARREPACGHKLQARCGCGALEARVGMRGRVCGSRGRRFHGAHSGDYGPPQQRKPHYCGRRGCHFSHQGVCPDRQLVFLVCNTKVHPFHHQGMVASVQNSHPGAVPSPHLPIKRPSVRNEVKAGAPEWKCMACGARTKLSTCKCKKSVMEKMPNPMAKLVLG